MAENYIQCKYSKTATFISIEEYNPFTDKYVVVYSTNINPHQELTTLQILNNILTTDTDKLVLRSYTENKEIEDVFISNFTESPDDLYGSFVIQIQYANSFWLPLKDYQLPYSQQLELHQTIAKIADYLHGLTPSQRGDKYEILMQYGTDVMSKYTDISELSRFAIESMLIENGYEYIIRLLTLGTDQLRSIVYFLPLIQALKGTRPGLELLLSTFCDALEITEEWEDNTGEMPPYTMKIDVIRPKNIPITSNIQDAIVEFCGEYVYPYILSIEVHLSYTDGFTNKTFVTCEVINTVTAYVQ